MKEQINRLGFGAWAENIIVNYLEDWGEVMRGSNKGHHTIEKDGLSVVAHWEYQSVSITVRAYVEGDGWQSLEQNIKIK